MLCGTCVAGIGRVTIYENGHFVDKVCGECQGIGYTCNRCGGNPSRCACDDDDKPPPRIVPQRQPDA